jgi:hypothetical protein
VSRKVSVIGLKVWDTGLAPGRQPPLVTLQLPRHRRKPPILGSSESGRVSRAV